MDESDSNAQLPLPAVPDKAGARIIPLPLPSPAPHPRAGKAIPKRPPLWYALYFPQLAPLPARRREAVLRALAACAESVSSTVSLHPLALVCEVRSSLRYFGDLDNIHRHLQKPLAGSLARQGLAADVLYAAAPTVTGSLLLARAGHNGLVYRPDNLRSALGRLGVEVLRLDEEASRRLYNMGVHHLRDIWRLPKDGLRRRFGSDLVDILDKALGLAPEPTRNYMPPPAFNTAYDLPYGIENLDRLMPVADEMLAQLADFLIRRDLGTSRLVFALGHEKREASKVDLSLRRPSRCRHHLLGLLETRLGRLNLPAPVINLRLMVTRFDAFLGQNDPLLAGPLAATPAADGNPLNLFLEQLRARMGGEPMQSISPVADHAPEYACQQQDYDSAGKNPPGTPPSVVSGLRPLWLLPEPQRLMVKNGRLYHRGALTILRGPERIETRWWAGPDIRRDYYIAREQTGSRLWIYRERRRRRYWYLHGIFA